LRGVGNGDALLEAGERIACPALKRELRPLKVVAVATRRGNVVEGEGCGHSDQIL
jgi:hypothetical protein